MVLLTIERRGEMSTASRYALLNRVRRLAERRTLKVAGFDVSGAFRFLLVGSDDAVRSFARALKSGTVQAAASASEPLDLGLSQIRGVVDPVEALIELHRDAGRGHDPLCTPWSSHRDLLGFREAGFLDRSVWDEVDPRWVHLRCGGGPLPVESTAPRGAALDLHLRVAAADRGVLPADPTTFRLFVHLARFTGARQRDIADALMLTTRRIRQLQSQPEPRLGAAALALSDQRLQRVP